MSSASAAPRPARSVVVAEDLAWGAFALVAGVATALLTVRSLQLGCTVVLVVLTVGLYVRSRSAGLVVVWLLWLLTPWLRRLFGLTGPFLNADPLALAPFVATGIVAAFELYRAQLSRFAIRVVGAGTLGYLVGLPAGLVSPESAAFAAVAYIVAIGCFAIGYREPPKLEQLTLRRVLLIAAPVLALYALAQYFLPLPEWDRVWLTAVQDTLVSIDAPDAEEHIRVYATLNSPGTFGMVMGIATVCYLALKRFSGLAILGIVLTLPALLLTYARSAWVATVLGMVAVLLASRGKATGRIAVVLVILVGGLALAAGTGPGSTIIGRGTTFGSLGSDRSANERQATPTKLLPEAISTPGGKGLGQAGEASRLGQAGSVLRNTDNGYLSLMFQTGLLGFLLVAGAAGACIHRAWRNVRGRADPVDVLVFGLITFFIVGLLAGDLLFGVTGMAFWYLLGIATHRNEVST